MPNPIAYLALALWPFATIALLRRLPLERAVIWSIFGAYLLLPPVADFDLPLVPDMNKLTIPNLALLAGLIYALRQKIHLVPSNNLARVLVFGYVLTVIPTFLTNTEPVIFGVLRNAEPIVFTTGRIPGMGPRDLFSLLIEQFLLIIPFLVAREFLGSEKGLRELLLALVVGGLGYSVLALFEIRFSPQLNIWLYGFFQHDFAQMMRSNGYRPIVFLQHGLWVAFLFMTSTVSAAALAQTSAEPERRKFILAAFYLFAVVILSKSLGSQLYALLFAPLVFLASPRLQIKVALVLVIIAVSYPILRQNDLVPLERLVDSAAAVSEERAQSLNYRFENEERLLARAQEKPLFGWGSWGRNLVRDVESGESTTIPDGEWIIQFGVFGWFGYICTMGLLSLPVVLLWWRSARWADTEGARHVAAVAVLLSVNMLDLLVNAILTPYTWLMTGALLGYCERRFGKRPASNAPNGHRTILGNPALPETRTLR